MGQRPTEEAGRGAAPYLWIKAKLMGSELKELVAHMRHDLIKHLDLPDPDRSMGLSEWQFLLRKLYDANSGITALAPVWVHKVESSSQFHSSLGEPLQVLTSAVQRLREQEEALRACAREEARVPEAVCDLLWSLRQAVLDLEEIITLTSDLTSDAELLNDAFFADWPETAAKEREQPNQEQKPERKIRVLIVDDRPYMVERLTAKREFLERIDWVRLHDADLWASGDNRRARHYAELLATLQRCDNESKPVDVLLMDLRFDDLPSEELLKIPEIAILNNDSSIKSLQGLIMARQLRLNPRYASIPIVLMTARTRLPAGADLLLDGLDGLQFVDDEASIDLLVNRVVGAAKRGELANDEGDFFWGKNARMQKIRRDVELLSQGPRTIILTGPSGSGKSYLVEHVILPLSGRKKLVTLDLSSIPDSLVESELFGHAKGAFSGADRERIGLAEEAEGGILFLDEIGNLSLENQRKLLLFLQDKMVRKVGASHRSAREVDVKVVAATHLDLAGEVEAKRFRFDLYMRLRPATQIKLPSLAERREDIENFLVNIFKRMLSSDDMRHLVEKLALRCATSSKSQIIFGSDPVEPNIINVRFPVATLEALRNYAWPGNTREMESTLDALMLKAFSEASEAQYPQPVLEIDHYYALTLLGSLQRQNANKTLAIDATTQVKKSTSSAITHEYASQTVQSQSTALSNQNIELPVKDLKELRQQLEMKFYHELMQKHDRDSNAMSEEIFGKSSDSLRHKLVVRMNQLGIKLRED